SYVSIPLLRMCTYGLYRLFWNIDIGIKLYEWAGNLVAPELVLDHHLLDRSEEEKPLKEVDVTNEVERRVDEKPAKDVIMFDKGTLTLISGKSKISFYRIPEPNCKIEKGIKNGIEPIAPTMTVNILVLEWEEKIKLHQEKKMKFDQWRSKIFNNEHLASVKEECEVEDEGGVTLHLIRRSLEVLRKFHWMILGG
ncbi:hypothetical protein Tco_0862243, partial [Tanacetum coccineum]